MNENSLAEVIVQREGKAMNKRCLTCGEGNLFETVANYTQIFNGKKFVFLDMPALKCDNLKCGDLHLNGPINDFVEDYISTHMNDPEKNFSVDMKEIK